MQDRYRRKEKRSDRFEDDSLAKKVSWEDQTEIKDGRDYSGNLSYTVDVGDSAQFSIDGFYVKTDRDVHEVSFEEELKKGKTLNLRVPGLDPYQQKNYGIGAEYKFDMAGGRTELSVDHARFQNAQATTEGEEVYKSAGSNFDEIWSIAGAEWDETVYEAEAVTAKDAETGFKFAHVRPAGAAEMEFGVDYRTKKRESRLVTYEWEADTEAEVPSFPPRL